MLPSHGRQHGAGRQAEKLVVPVPSEHPDHGPGVAVSQGSRSAQGPESPRDEDHPGEDRSAPDSLAQAADLEAIAASPRRRPSGQFDSEIGLLNSAQAAIPTSSNVSVHTNPTRQRGLPQVTCGMVETPSLARRVGMWDNSGQWVGSGCRGLAWWRSARSLQKPNRFFSDLRHDPRFLTPK